MDRRLRERNFKVVAALQVAETEVAKHLHAAIAEQSNRGCFRFRKSARSRKRLRLHTSFHHVLQPDSGIAAQPNGDRAALPYFVLRDAQGFVERRDAEGAAAFALCGSKQRGIFFKSD